MLPWKAQKLGEEVLWVVVGVSPHKTSEVVSNQPL